MDIYHKEDATNYLMKGIEAVYETVRTSLGPKGSNVVLDRGHPYVTHDGVTIARGIVFDDERKLGAELIKRASISMNDNVGDGTTSVTILAYHLVKEAQKLVAAGYNPMELRKGFELAKDDALKELEKLTDKNIDLKAIATLSTASEEIGEVVSKVIEEVGKGIVTVDPVPDRGITSEIIHGYTIDNSVLAPNMVVGTSNLLEGCAVVVTSRVLKFADELLPLMEKLMSHNVRKLYIMAKDVDVDPLNTMIVNKSKGLFDCIATKVPTLDEDTLDDIATFIGGKVFRVGNWPNRDTVEEFMEHVGFADVLATRNRIAIFNPDGDPKEVQARIKVLNERKKLVSGELAEDLELRASKLASKMGVIKVGGSTDTEISELKDRVDDGVCATRAALDGIVAGGGTTYVELSNRLKSETLDDKGMGYNALKKALLQPYIQLMENSGITPRVENIKDGKGYSVFDPEKLIDLKDNKIIDPALVIREAIINAVAVAGTIITTGSVVARKVTDERVATDKL